VKQWPGRRAAESARQWPILVDLADRVEAEPALDGLILIGSFAAGTADELSDVDSVVVATEGSFDAAWDRRRDLDPSDALYAWDIRPDPTLEVGGRKFITRNIVKVECLIATPSSGVRLADPFVVAVGDESLGERFRRVPPIPREELDDYAKEQREVGNVPEIEMLYSALMCELRSVQRPVSTDDV
jgi:predicted nucleotidyltransferase